jgi:predicted membrane-bound spermidine synthase
LPLGFYLGFGFGCALLCGLQFPLALQRQGGGNPAVARIFSADLVGAACGTLATSTILIPRFGIYGAAAGLILLKLASFGWLTGKRHATVEPKTFSVR